MNDLVIEIKHLDLGIHLDSVTVDILLYADDVVLLAETGEDLQAMINVLQNWCCTWRLSIKYAKTLNSTFQEKIYSTKHKGYYFW